MRPAALLALLALSAPPLAAQGQPTLPQTEFVRVATDSTLRMRGAPSTEAPVITELAPGTLLRNLGCSALPEPWCQLQSVDGARAGWVAADYVAPFDGADPAALISPAVPATERRTLELRPGLIYGSLPPGGILDLVTDAPADVTVSLRLDGPDSIGLAAFVRPATRLAQGDAQTPLALVLPEGGELLIRLADRSGAGGDWQLILGLD